MQKQTQNSGALLAATSLMLLGGVAGAQTPTIHVTVNGTPLTFAGTLPREVRGSVLVPMRGVFEALGATVRFDKSSQTIYGQKGATSIILPLGALLATVNGQPQTLPQPAQLVNGTTLVPLRFVSQALGATPVWDPFTKTVSITTIDSHLATLPATPGTGNISGQVTGVYPNTTPVQITLMRGGQNTSVPISPATIILRSATDQPAVQVALTQIKPGDQVTVERGPDGTATVVTAIFGEVRGTIVSIGRLPSGNAAITLDSGKVIELAPDTPITMAGRSVGLSDVKNYEKVVIRTNPSNDMGYGMAVTTAGNPNPTPPGITPVSDPGPTVSTVSIDSFTQDATKPLKAGDVLTATLAGTPGGKATFAIPGVTDSVPMKETSPGVYSGSFIIPRGTSVPHAAVVGKLVVSGVTSTLIQAAGNVTMAGNPPRITDFGPAKGTEVETQRPVIYGTLSDTGAGINPNATRISLDGVDVTGEATITPTLFTYKPGAALANGQHLVHVSVADTAGNTAAADWTFGVAASRLIKSFTTNEPSGQSVGAGSTIVFTLNAQPGGKASVSLGSLVKNIPLAETDPGIYVGEYTVLKGDNLQNTPVTAKYVAPDGTAVTTNLTTALTIAAGPPPAPKITSPENNGYVDATQPLSVEGKATPGLTVRVTVNYVSKALGGILPVSGSTGSKDVVADKSGHWIAEELSLKTNIFLGRDTSFTVSAVTLDASGGTSDPAQITLQPQ